MCKCKDGNQKCLTLHDGLLTQLDVENGRLCKWIEASKALDLVPPPVPMPLINDYIRALRKSVDMSFRNRRVRFRIRQRKRAKPLSAVGTQHLERDLNWPSPRRRCLLWTSSPPGNRTKHDPPCFNARFPFVLAFINHEHTLHSMLQLRLPELLPPLS
jgi:hypothetical protein